jgi:DNA-damage-inducible protein J
MAYKEEPKQIGLVEKPHQAPVVTTVRLDPEVKRQATQVFGDLGLSFNSGLDVYVRTVARQGCIPFDLTLRD